MSFGEEMRDCAGAIAGLTGKLRSFAREDCGAR
jgi:hypothetical protein